MSEFMQKGRSQCSPHKKEASMCIRPQKFVFGSRMQVQSEHNRAICAELACFESEAYHKGQSLEFNAVEPLLTDPPRCGQRTA